MTTFYIIRHGQSQANQQGILQGAKINTALTSYGRQQALATKAKLAGISFYKIFASPLLRAAQTAALINDNQPVTFDCRLKEYDYGSWDGMLEKDIWQQYPQFFDTHHNLLPGFEKLTNAPSFAQTKQEVGEFLTQVAKKYPTATVLVVSHGFTIKLMLDWLLDIGSLVNLNEPQNAGITIFEISHNAKTLLAFNR